MYTRKFFVYIWLFLVLLAAGGCAAAAPDASKAISRGIINSGDIVPAEQLRIAEYLNYYGQSFPEPANAAVGLDLRLGNEQLPANGGDAWLQIGLQARSAQNETVAPLNLALVIDCSGSMADADKMPYLKQSLRLFLQSLKPDDRVAVVAYNNTARVVLPSQPAGSLEWLERTINDLYPAGSTNLYDGLMLGFQEVDRNFDVRRNNRVILLTDGIANVGTTDPDTIAADAGGYNSKGIYLSTIGLGRDFQDSLLIRLATQGKGGYHFIDSAAEMDKVFRQEVAGLVQKAAGDVSILLHPGAGVRVLSLTGYDGEPPAGPIQVRLRDMGTGDSQVVLAHVDVAPGSRGPRELAQVELRYSDLFAQREATAQGLAMADAGLTGGYEPLQDVEVLRNVTIQRTAEGMKEIDRLYQAQRYQAAWDLAYRLEGDLRRVARLTNEDQMVKDADLMRRYQDTLARWVERQTGHSPLRPDRGQDTSSDRPLPEDAATAPMIDIK
jgi:Ca-activated chloride channel homolog